ncbi:MAG: right-handed parallel beta-helix repeat-containing protein [Candidatus Bathyarchaeia archaeon]|jgi:parallel beta-helix repeat protein
MKKAKFVKATLIVLLIFMATSTTERMTAMSAPSTIRINADGSLEPANVPIRRDGDVYTFTGNVDASIVVDRDNVVIDGAGYTLRGTYNGTRTDNWVVGEGPNQEASAIPWTIGIDVASRGRYNLTVKNLNIKNFYIGMYIWSSNNTITGNAVTDNIVGILLSGDHNTITKNYIAHNEQGIFFGVNTPGNEPLNIVLTHNSFVENTVQFSGCFCETYNPQEAVHTWDDGSRGNYWSDYNGFDVNGDGVGDGPYVIDPQNQDRFPLMQPEATPPTQPPAPSAWMIAAAGLATVGVIAAIALTAVYIKKKKAQFNVT